ncbi:MAG TPA: hypothetical protein VFE31_10550 [Opitutaceae bacterium]|nr:hypothetical protein [Opitutaceae bacterium]
MNDAEVIDMMCRHYEGLFPMECPACHRRFATLREYIAGTQRVGVGRHYDAELGNWDPEKPIGGVAMANCSCGTTLTLGIATMSVPQQKAALQWIRTETARRRISQTVLLEYVRDEVRRRTLADSGPSLPSRGPSPDVA